MRGRILGNVKGEKIAIGRAGKMLAKEDGGVDGQIPAHADAPDGCERAQRDVSRRAASRKSEYPRNEERNVECPSGERKKIIL